MDLMQVKFICPVRQFYENVYSFTVIPSKPGKILVFLSLVKLLLQMVKLNEVSQPVSIE